ncbi:DUF2946 family protein [Sphingomicrobium sediminis]|uniref:DUF2946 family protein n=1 Tax=Sphingomicrobium sediminis TaxID=2950949 RepID=A0A9X2EH01_9SPHN|nr:DUF2946 family protein [Sphingomicrobium sediminis]MCM8557360.1 DUF2946 family protein [Sphingomicrobium sediminis]
MLTRTLLALAMLMLAAIPSGFMPVATASGWVLHPCPAQQVADMGEMIHHADMDHGEMGASHVDHETAFEKPDCGFAGVAQAALGGSDAMKLSTAQAGDLRDPLELAAIIGAQRRAPRPPSRAPPSA